MHIQSGGYVEDSLVVWQIEGEEIDFTRSEFEEILAALRQQRLFAILKEMRPALADQLLAIFESRLIPDVFEQDDLETRLENFLFHLYDRARVEWDD
ncbi:MAG: hypothetical protein KDK34_22610 [Leptospiraceae bacterium]|nr:hypothetical protein [Leptospiraceae bacterium]MCB1323067.1 hypothetical protein [Leptospiraceae bacterium]